MKVSIFNVMIYLCLLFLFSCNKIDLKQDVPKCIKKKIKAESDSCLDSVYKYNYQGEEVYLFIPMTTCPDKLYYLYDCNCDLICSPDGGISGKGDGTCSDFYQQAINKECVWSKE